MIGHTGWLIGRPPRGKKIYSDKTHNIPEGMIWKRIRLAFLSPKILRAIVGGKTNRDLTIKMLTQHDLPLEWSEQETLFLG